VIRVRRGSLLLIFLLRSIHLVLNMSENVDARQEESGYGANGVDVTESGEIPSIIVGDLSRIARHAQIADAEGFPHESRVGVDDGVDDFIEVDYEDVSEYSLLFHRRPDPQQALLDELHPFVQLLSLSNVNDCVNVEATFPESERGTREKVCLETN
jgi:hypothetical protein